MADELKDQRIPIMMSPSEVKAIDDWMFKARIRSRAEAIRRLCQTALVFSDLFPKINNLLAESADPIRDLVDGITDNPASDLKVYTKFSHSMIDLIEDLADNIDDLKEAFVTVVGTDIQYIKDISEDRETLYQIIREARRQSEEVDEVDANK